MQAQRPVRGVRVPGWATNPVQRIASGGAGSSGCARSSVRRRWRTNRRTGLAAGAAQPAERRACRRQALGLTRRGCSAGLATYPGLPHRMERVARDGRRTLRQRQQGDQPDLGRAGARRLPGIRWICGGLAQGRRPRRMRAAFRPCPPPTPSARPAGCSRGCSTPPCRSKCEMLCEAVKPPRPRQPGDVVLLSPACALRPVPRLRGARRRVSRDRWGAMTGRQASPADQGHGRMPDPAAATGARTARPPGRWFWEIDRVLLLLMAVLIGIGRSRSPPPRPRPRSAIRAAACASPSCTFSTGN